MSLNSAVQQLTAGLSTLMGGLIIYNDDAKKLHNYPYVGYIGIAMAVIAVIVGRNVKPAAQHHVAPRKEQKQEAFAE
jgi:predicted MFS family arabinose efflux permease